MLEIREPEIQIEAGSAKDSREQEILRNLQVLYGTQTGEQALDREFGIDTEIMDYPQETAMAMLAAEYVRKTERYEPRAKVQRVDFKEGKGKDGNMIPKVVVSIV